MVEQTGEKVAEHFDDAAQQEEAVNLGMWTFLTTEVLFFGALFTGYTIYRIRYPLAFTEASQHLYTWIGAINTAILLISSTTLVLAIHATENASAKRASRYLLITVLLGLAFLCMKGIEYSFDFKDHIVPGSGFRYEGPANPAHVQLFMVFYFIMTGLHGLHVLVGVGILTVMTHLSRRGVFVTRGRTPLEISGLYWHFVDVVWIFLFPLLYLVRS